MCSSSTLRGSGKTTRVARRLFSSDRIDAILRRRVGGAQLEDSRGQLVVRLEPSEVAQAFVDHQREHAPPALLGYATDVRRQKDVVRGRAIGDSSGTGSGSKTSRQATISPRASRVDQGLGVDDPSARNVHENAAG